MKKIMIIAFLVLTLASVSVATATASSASISGEACVINAPNEVNNWGHVGWGFELPNGTWWFGANEGNTLLFPSKTWFHDASWASMLATFIGGGPYHNTGYTRYRCVTVPASNPSAAEEVAISESNEPYKIPLADCESQAYNVLRSYGVRNLPDDATVWFPNDWFNDLSQAGFGSVTRL